MAMAAGIPHKEVIKNTCSETRFHKIETIIRNLRALPDEYLVVDLKGYPYLLSFIQTIKTDDVYLVEVAFDNRVYSSHPQIFRRGSLSLDEAIAEFRDVVLNKLPIDALQWDDVTREVFYKKIRLNVFKQAYKIVRENSDEIYKAFGFRHLADATRYYVHPDNQSYKGTTSLCQSIGEAVMLFAGMVKSIEQGKPFGDYCVSPDGKQVYLELTIPEDYRVNGVVDEKVFRYKALSEGSDVTVAAYAADGSWIQDDMMELSSLYKLLPVFLVLLGREIEENPGFHALADNFLADPVVDAFVNVHEDFYQNHKADEYEISYADIDGFDRSAWTSCASTYAVVRENKAEAMKKELQDAIAFPKERFTPEQQFLIPKLSDEFVLPENLVPLCSAVTGGDLLAVLLHGPAGTGKTISCKLICQKIGLPIMETINCTENLDEFVLGKFIPQDEKIIFKESYVTKAIRDGGAVVFEEINFAKPQYLAFLNSLLDDNGFVRLDNGDVVRRHPDFRFFATMNMGYFGTRELNQSLYNRFNAVIEVAALSDEAITRMLTARVPECEPVVSKLLGVYRKVKKKIEAEELDVVISPRNLENWARLARYEGYVKAAEKTIIPIAKCDRTLEDTIRGIMMLYKWKV